LNVFPIHLPPLRERVEDIEPLAEFFTRRWNKSIGKNIRRISSTVIQQLKSYLWPGNVRELEHLIERSILLADESEELLKQIWLPRLSEIKQQAPSFAVPGSLEKLERGYITEVLKRCRGKISGIGGAADLLEIPGTTLHSKIKKLGINKADYFAR
ncbi:MAG: AAA family ATPase, partial [Chitinophagaceae bacterium]